MGNRKVDKMEIVRLLNEGLTQSEVARELNTSREYVRQVKVQAGVNYVRPTQRNEVSISSDFLNGMKIVELSDKYNLSTWIITAMLKRTGSIETMKMAKRELYDLGLSDGKIAEKLNMCAGSIFYWRKKNGLPANYEQKNKKNFFGKPYKK